MPTFRASRPGPGRRARFRFTWIGVAASVVAVLAALPLIYLLVRSAEAGAGEIVEVVTDRRSLELLLNTTALAVAVTATSVIIGVPIAWLTARSDLPMRRVWLVLTALPLGVPSYIGAFAFIAALGPRGLVQGWLEPLGIERLPSLYGFAGAWIVLSLFTYPYVLLTVRSALLRLDPSQEEASRTLGRSRLATFRHVVLPQLRPSIVAGGLLVALYTLADFGAVAMLRFDSFTRAIHLQYQGAFDRSRAAILGLMLVAFTIAVLTGELMSRRAAAYHRLHAGSQRRAPVSRLGRWRWPITVALALLVLVALATPLGVIGIWLNRGVQAGEPLRLTGQLMLNSLRAAGTGALFAVIAAWPVAFLSARRPGRFTRGIEAAAWTGYALPGIVVALSLVFLGTRVVPSLYQTHWMLTFAYTVLFLPQAVGAIRASLLQVSPSLEDASRVLGRGPATTFRRVLLPLAAPASMAGGALVFLTIMKELPATLLLAPTGFPTLATQVWSSTSESMFARGALPALMLIVLSSIPVVILAARQDGEGTRTKRGLRSAASTRGTQDRPEAERSTARRG